MKKILISEEIPEFFNSIERMPDASVIFIDKSLAISAKVYEIMQRKNLSQKELAIRMDKAESDVSRMLAGMHNITLRMIAKLESALGESIITINNNK